MCCEKTIDLSHPLRPGHEARTLEIKRLESTHITGAPDEDAWYIMHHVHLVNHMGTHIEVPYHCLEEGADLGNIPASHYVGEAVILDLRDREPNHPISVSEVKRAAADAGGVSQGDIVFCMTGWSEYYGTRRYDEPPFLTQDALRWLVHQSIKLLGVDTRGSMSPATPDRENHLPMMESGVSYIENLTNLESVPFSRVLVAALPPAIHGLEGFPVRVVALV